MKLTAALAAVLVVLVASGCGSDPVQAGPDTDTTGGRTNGSIRGIVTDNTGATVPNAAVGLTGSALAARSATSGADGAYTFADVPTGAYTLRVTPPAGYTVGVTDTASVAVASGARADAPAIVLYSCGPLQAPLRVDFFGGVATDADRALFAYDVAAPLDLQTTVETTSNGVQRSAISFTSPDGGRVPGLLLDPVGRSSLRPAVVYLQGFPGRARGGPTIAAAQQLAEHGAVVIVIDIPAVRRPGDPIRLLPEDRAEQIQLIKDLQRAVDVLRSRPNVDPARIGFVGHSYGGAMGALFVGIERRLRAAVLMAADGGIVTHVKSSVSDLPCETRNDWMRTMAPIEPLRFIALAPPTALLMQNGRQDPATLPADAEVLHEAAPASSIVKWYDAGHGLNQQATLDRLDWLHEQIGIDPR